MRQVAALLMSVDFVCVCGPNAGKPAERNPVGAGARGVWQLGDAGYWDADSQTKPAGGRSSCVLHVPP